MCSSAKPFTIRLVRLGILAMVAGGSLAANSAGTSRPATIAYRAAYSGRYAGARSTLAAIAAEWRECGQRGSGGDPPELVDCDYRAWTASDALLRRSRGNRGFRSLLNDLFDPLEDRLTGGEDALAIRVVVAYSRAELSLRRAAILTGMSPTPLAGEHIRYSIASLLRWPATPNNDVVRELIGPRAAQTWLRRWRAVRNRDCAAYRVPRCAVLLDGAFRRMLYDLLTDGGRQRRPALRA